MTPDANGWQTAKEVAYRFGVTPTAVWHWGHKGKVDVRLEANPGTRPLWLYRIEERPPKRKCNPISPPRQLTKQELRAIAVLKRSGLTRYRIYMELGK